MYNTFPNAPNFGAYVSPWVTTSAEDNPSEPYLLELAEAYVATENQTRLLEIFPEETIEQRLVGIQQSFSATNTIFPLVEPGQPDVFTEGAGGTVVTRWFQPLYIRASASFSPAKINYLAKPGTNTRQSPQEYIDRELQRMALEHNLTWDVFRAMMLLGGINYTDPRTGVKAQVGSQIPAWNLLRWDVNNGYRGRNEANIFRSMIDQYGEGFSTEPGVPWAHPDADIAGTIRRLKRFFKVQNKSEITDAFVHPDLWEIINQSTQVRLAQGGILPRWDVEVGDRIPNDSGVTYFPNSGFDQITSRSLQLNAAGEVEAIAGVRFHTLETKFKDPVDGVWKGVMPKNKVVFVSMQDPNGRAEAPGRTQFCISENLDDRPGLWVRTWDMAPPPQAPVRLVQMGNAGMPYLKYPHRVCHLTVASVDAINERIGLQGDDQFGMY